MLEVERVERVEDAACARRVDEKVVTRVHLVRIRVRVRVRVRVRTYGVISPAQTGVPPSQSSTSCR